VGITRHGDAAAVTGGNLIQAPDVTTAEQWCAFYGVEVENGVAILYKAVDAEFKSRQGMSYAPGTQPEAPDWDGSEEKCAGGLHFSPFPFVALQFTPNATRFLACPVRVADMVVGENGTFSQKVKARGACGPVYEVDEYGRRVS
jgi:hypothetical protein